MPEGTPISFGHSQELPSVVADWATTPSTNHGVVPIAEELDGLAGDQHINFLRDAVLRLTLVRE